MTVSFMKYPECIDKSCIKKMLKSFPLFISKSVLPAVWLGIRKIIFSMSDIEVSTKKDRLFLLKFLHMCKKCGVPGKRAKRKPSKVIFTVGSIDTNNKEILKFCRDNSPLLLQISIDIAHIRNIFKRFCESQRHLKRRYFRKNSSAAIPCSFSWIPKFVIVWKFYSCLSLLCFCFLKTQDIRIMLSHKFLKNPFFVII